jgi:hypothetical protein
VEGRRAFGDGALAVAKIFYRLESSALRGVAVSGRSVKVVDEVDVTVRRRGWIQDVFHGVELDPRREWGRSAVGSYCLRYPSLDTLVIHSRRVLQDLGCVVGDDGRLSIV